MMPPLKGRWMRGRVPNELTITTLLLFIASGQQPSTTYHPFSLPMLLERLTLCHYSQESPEVGDRDQVSCVCRTGAFYSERHYVRVMKSTRKGLRNDELHKDNYERVACSECDETLKKDDDDNEIYAVRTCPECGQQWKELP